MTENTKLPAPDLPDPDLPDGDLPDGDLPDGDLPDGDLPDLNLPDPDLPAAALRALAEAEERRKVTKLPGPREMGGRGGLEPVRYGDWEKKGLAIDF